MFGAPDASSRITEEIGICWEENGVDGALGWIVTLKYTHTHTHTHTKRNRH